MKRFSLPITLIMTAILFATLLSGTASAKVVSSAKHCQVVLDRLHPGEGVSRVLSQQCVTGYQQLVPHYPGCNSISCIHLMTWYDAGNYTGNSVKIYGDSGGCDSAGYAYPYVGDDWNDRISSFQGANSCNYTRASSDSNYNGPCFSYDGDQSQLGPFDKRISSIRISSIHINC